MQNGKKSINGDPRGYYAILGVQSSAPDKLIKAAYRIRAQELHPDLNRAPDANEQFQRLAEAYSVLSEPNSRREYDESAQGIGTQSTTKTSTPSPEEDRTFKTNWEPITCHRCGAISALPRYREYRTVKGLLVTALYTNEGGVYCSKCDTRKALIATGITTIFGWWSIQGVFYSVVALWHNLTAGLRFKEKNIRILVHQAGYFFSRNKLDLARALAEEVLRVAPKFRMTSEQKRRAKLGYLVRDPLEDAKGFARQLISTAAGTSSKVRLKQEPPFANRRTVFQLGMLAPAIALVCFAVVSCVHQEEVAQYKKAIAEAVRLEQEGMRANQIQKIAEGQRAALEAKRTPMPISGLMHYDHPTTRRLASQGEQLPRLKVQASGDSNYLVKLEDAATHNPALTVFVRAGETAVVDVPVGIYRVKLASGSSWYGETERFGPHTAYYALDHVSEFRREGNMLIGQELTLTPVRNGNLTKTGITAAEF